MVDPVFQAQVDNCLAVLEQSQPTWQRLRRVPMDMIAEAVALELEHHQTACRILQWKDPAVQRALIAVGLRNGAVLRVVSQSMT